MEISGNPVYFKLCAHFYMSVKLKCKHTKDQLRDISETNANTFNLRWIYNVKYPSFLLEILLILRGYKLIGLSQSLYHCKISAFYDKKKEFVT